MNILHVVPGLAEKGNGIAVAADLIAEEQRKAGGEVEVVETQDFVSASFVVRHPSLGAFSEIWVHSNWLPATLRACRRVIDAKVPLVRMTHANLDPVRLRYHRGRKLLVSPIERWLYRRTARVVVTCEAERRWCEDWGVKGPFEIVDLKRFFQLGKGLDGIHTDFVAASSLGRVETSPRHRGCFRVLYLGRRHPLKGVEYLEKAVDAVRKDVRGTGREIELRIVSDHDGEELERDWAWCDILCLPTLSENFGLVVAEALERGKRVVTSDGAPVWETQPGVAYLRGYRAGTDDERVNLLKTALEGMLRARFAVFEEN